MWAYVLIIIASDKVINFKTTFFSWSKWHYIEIKSECREGCGPGTQVIAAAVTARPSCATTRPLEMVVIDECGPLHQKELGMEM